MPVHHLLRVAKKVGKSTQVRRLVEALAAGRLRRCGRVSARWDRQAEAIRRSSLQGHWRAMGTGAEAWVLFAAARLDHVNAPSLPNLEAGRWVVSDRFSDSTRAYQGLTGGVDVKPNRCTRRCWRLTAHAGPDHHSRHGPGGGVPAPG